MLNNGQFVVEKFCGEPPFENRPYFVYTRILLPNFHIVYYLWKNGDIRRTAWKEHSSDEDNGYWSKEELQNNGFVCEESSL